MIWTGGQVENWVRNNRKQLDQSEPAPQTRFDLHSATAARKSCNQTLTEIRKKTNPAKAGDGWGLIIQASGWA